MFFNKIIPFVIIFLLTLVSVFALFVYAYGSTSNSAATIKTFTSSVGLKEHNIIGFLPYWLLGKADKDYSRYLTTLTYFGLTISPDGSIQKYVNPGEAEPGWFALQSGKVDSFLTNARKYNQELSLLLFSVDKDTIGKLISDPVNHANSLTSEVGPIMNQYGFTNLNLDIEDVSDASPAAQQNFSLFVKQVRQNMMTQKMGTLTIDVSPTDLIKKRLIDLPSIEPYVDSIVLMTYDYHYAGSFVTGPVSPIEGAGIDSEFDSETAIQIALKITKAHKILLGIPLYGYEWETVTPQPRSAVIPGSGLVISNRRLEKLLSTCASCSAQIDRNAHESYLVYKDQETQTYHQIFYPDERSLLEKLSLSTTYKLGGTALWALGYEGNTILKPLEAYKQSLQ